MEKTTALDRILAKTILETHRLMSFHRTNLKPYDKKEAATEVMLRLQPWFNAALAEWVRSKRKPDTAHDFGGVTATWTGMSAEELQQALLADLENDGSKEVG